GDYGLEIYANSIGVSEDFLAKNPEIVKKFVRAALKGWKDALGDPEEAARIEIQYVKALDPQIVVEEIQILKRIAITPDVEKNGFGYISTDRMKNTVDFINNNIEVSGDKLTAEQVYRPGYLPDVAIKPGSRASQLSPASSLSRACGIGWPRGGSAGWLIDHLRMGGSFPGANSLAATARNSLRRSPARSAPNTVSNRACAWDQPLSAACRRFSPALVRCRSLARRSDAVGSMLIRPSRSSGKMLRPSVVRSITMSSASALIVNGPLRLSRARMENWVVRSPLGAKNRS